MSDLRMGDSKLRLIVWTSIVKWLLTRVSLALPFLEGSQPFHNHTC
ncbi:hypothetical protein BH09CHL1_BH09CHL1_25470 [soil metagenome]